MIETHYCPTCLFETNTRAAMIDHELTHLPKQWLKSEQKRLKS
jgi:hypothetical protein